ncbi:Leucine Rich Repeat [Seminavis robusta]|uniref:Leucine Rich Repeat n=1 Tax=Seminavis robusta TaxID=568900 RepID=A0A9N8E736_9STRA|nr:Leucine Rich Repeat [Seminavis robusta]|eukprot:Sro614_g175770.1 Leucine Rich Repeat (553) ;mRNA; f:40427-42085
MPTAAAEDVEEKGAESIPAVDLAEEEQVGDTTTTRISQGEDANEKAEEEVILSKDDGTTDAASSELPNSNPSDETRIKKSPTRAASFNDFPMPLPTRKQHEQQAPGAYAVVRMRPVQQQQQQQQDDSTHDDDDDEEAAMNEGAPLDAALVDSNHDERLAMTEDLPTSSSRAAVTTLVQAQVLPERTESERRAKNFVLWGFAVAALLVVLMGVVFGIGDSKEEDSTTTLDPPTEQTTSTNSIIIWYPPFQETLPASTRKAIASDYTSDQYRGNAWMQNDPHLDSYPPNRQLQRFALVTTFYGTHGDHWFHNDHWLDYDVSECDWFTQSFDTICDEHHNLLTIDLHHNNLQGTIPQEAQFIPHLQYSDMSYNQIAGGLPNFVSNDQLQVIKVSHNQMAGPLVSQAGFSAFDLRVIELDGNAFSGYIAPVYQYLPRLERINLTSNAFTGTLPEELVYATNLAYAGLGHNQYHGEIPSSFGILTALEGLDVSGMEGIHGTLPSELGTMVALRQLDITGTNITGVVPEAVCDLVPEGLVLKIDCDKDDLQCCSDNSI